MKACPFGLVLALFRPCNNTLKVRQVSVQHSYLNHFMLGSGSPVLARESMGHQLSVQHGQRDLSNLRLGQCFHGKVHAQVGR